MVEKTAKFSSLLISSPYNESAMQSDGCVTLRRKNCVNGFVSVFDFVATALSAQNHSVLPPLKYIVVYSAGCATFVLPLHVAKDIRGALAHLQFKQEAPEARVHGGIAFITAETDSASSPTT
ncbi:BnaC06g11230D [Brassica napus]|uniref:BnaC06g11230D protein n=2 Tax=Brassica TaxID=3705 RepID=A0A078GN88_BRANA|nr:BnaC06g11230D [Brassica napus]